MKQKINLPQFDYVNVKVNLENNSLIVYGAGMFIEPVIISLKQKGLNPLAIVDSNNSKQDTLYMGITAISPHSAIEKFPNSLVVIASAPHLIKEISEYCKLLGWTDVIDAACLLSDFDFDNSTFTNGVSQINFNMDNYYFEYCRIYLPELVIVKQLDVMITERCSLKCKDCSNLMQYYIAPTDADKNITYFAVEKFAISVDYILELRVIGGEPFVNKECFEIIDFLKSISNKSRICVYTNGTIIPKDTNLKSLVGDNIFLRISDYGGVSRNVSGLVKALDNANANYDVIRFEKWQDCAKIEYFEESEAQLAVKFKECCVQNYFTILNDNLYNCPFAANAININAIPKFKDEFIEIPMTNVDDIRRIIRSMIYEKKYYGSCKYCAGRPLDDTPLVAALQTKTTLPFKSYVINQI
jgi:organic radical activating enzyme